MNKKIKPMIYQTERKMELLHTDKYKNYKYYILNLGTHPTAYIAIPKGHKLYGQKYNDIYAICDIDVHGGLTYCDNNLMGIDSEDLFIGWDYAHAGDYMGYYEDFKNLNNWGISTIISLRDEKKWTTEEIIKECENAIEQIIELEKEVK